MRASEFVTELVSRANKLDHFKNRIAVAAKLCEKLGDQPLVYRAFSHNHAMTLLAKIDNSDIKNPQARKGGVGAKNQMAILQQLEIQYPVFCRMTPPSSARGFHGLESIFIPIGDVTPYWSPRIRDLGGIDYIRDSGEYHQSHVPVPGMPGVTRGNPGELDQTERWVKTYQHAWPNATTDHELIFDCASYYLLDMEVFFTKFAGKELKGMIDAKSRSSWKPINPEAFNKLKTYSNVAWYLNNTAMSYLNWWETKDLEKPVDANRNTQTLEERRKKTKVRQAGYGPGLYGGYGYYSDYGNNDSGGGDGGGGGESIEQENFADGRNPQDKGDAKRHGVPTKASVSTLRKVAKQGGRKGQLAHWMANMKSGKKK